LILKVLVEAAEPVVAAAAHFIMIQIEILARSAIIDPKLTWNGCSPTRPSATMCSTGSRFVGVPQKMQWDMQPI